MGGGRVRIMGSGGSDLVVGGSKMGGVKGPLAIL